MYEILKEYIKDIPLTGDLQSDIFHLLTHYRYPNVYEHCCRVADEASRLAELYGEDPAKAYMAGLLHDIGAIIPKEKRVELSEQLGMEVLQEEEAFPMILHQKYSRLVAHTLLGITDAKVLSAIECHTTLKADAARFDMLLFIADKLQWDQKGQPPFENRVRAGLEISLEKGTLAYIEYLLEDLSRLKVVHPWLLAAYNNLHQSKNKVVMEETNE